MSTPDTLTADTAEQTKAVVAPLNFGNFDDHGKPLPQQKIDAYKACPYGPGAYYDTEE